MLCYHYANLCHLVGSRQSQLPARCDATERVLRARSVFDEDTQP